MLLAVAGMYGQSPAPGILNYQGVARNSVGNVLVNKNITLRLTIRDGSAAGPTVYAETRPVTTNPFGLFNVQLGSPGATSVTGTIAGVPWGVGLKYIQVEIDPNGGSTFINIGTAQLASVPYALYATTANDLVLPFNKTQADNGTLFRITNSGNNSGSTALEGLTNSTQSNAAAIIGTVTSAAPGGFSAGVRGINNGTGGLGIGVYGSQAGSGWGVYGTAVGGIGVNGFATTGIGVNGTSTSGTAGRFQTTSGLSLWTSGGGVRMQNIGEAANRILATVTGTGDATWVDPSAVGIVSGSGTLNFVPKWTPNGTTLGNSQLFDNGTLVGVGAGNAPFAAKLDVLSGQQQIIAHRFTGVTGFDLFYNNSTQYNGYIGTWNTATSTRNFDVGTGDINNVGSLNLVTQALPRMSILPDGTVGVNTTAPVATSKMHINGAGTTGSITDRTSLFAGGNLDGANGHGVIANGEWRAVWGRNLGTGGRIEATGVRGEAGGSNYTNGAGVLGTATGTGSNAGVFGIASGSASLNIGLRGQATGATAGQNWGVYAQTSTAGGQNVAVAGQAPIAANSWAGAFFGRVNITDGTQGLNRVFTSDASGNGSWQPLGAIGGVNGSGTLNFVAKWTPDGSTIGNSIIFDDGSTATVGGAGFTAPNSLSLRTTSASGANASMGMVTSSQAGGLFLQESTGDMHFTVNANDVDNGNVVMTIEDNSLNVGIGTTTPSVLSKLHVQGYGAGFPRNAVWANGDLGSTDGHGIVADGEWRGVWGRNNGAGGRFEASGIRGTVAGTNYSVGYGARGDATGTAADNYGVYGAASGGTNRNIGVYGTAPVAANDFAGYFDGKILINDGTQAAGRILTSVGASGEATWSTAAGAGLVSGSGTLNYVPKWTPNGTTLGNSLIYDDGQRAQVGDNVIAGSSLGINPTPGSPLPSITWYKSATGNAFNIHESDNGSLHVEANNTSAGAGSIIMTYDDDNLSVGIGNTAPAARLDIDNTATTIGAALINQNNETTIPGMAVYTNNISTRFTRLTSIFAQRENWVGGTTYFVNDNAIFGAGMNGTTGVQGTSQTGFGVAAVSQSGTALRAATLSGTALVTSGGGVRFQDIGAADGYVLTSDASGNATWRGNVGISLKTLTSSLSIPSGVSTPITQWNTVQYEDGGANYNPGTGEYTISTNGVYTINAALLWDPFSAPSNLTAIRVFVNGSFEYEEFTNASTTAYFSTGLSYTRRLNAGDRIVIHASQFSGSNQTITAGYYGQSFSVNLNHR